MVLVLDERVSSTSTSTAGAEYEYEKDAISLGASFGIFELCNFKTLASSLFRREIEADVGGAPSYKPVRVFIKQIHRISDLNLLEELKICVRQTTSKKISLG